MIKSNNGTPKPERAAKTRFRSATEAFEEALKRSPFNRAKYCLKLYVTGSSARSLRAVYNLRKLCDEYLAGNYELEVIDIYKDPSAARDEQIIAAPTLVKTLPRPLRKFVGDLSNSQKLLTGLDINKP